MPLQGEFAASGPRRVVFGPGARHRLLRDVIDSGARRLLVLASRSLRDKTSFVAELEHQLGDRLALTSSPPAYVPGDVVLDVAEQGRERAIDGVVSIGGGSVSDLGKAVAFVLAEGIRDTDTLRGRRIVSRPGGGFDMPPARGSAPVPHWVLPTTLSAAEFTSGFGIADPSAKAMDNYNHPGLAVRCVGLDCELVVATPPELWLSTGVLAVNHCVESLYSVLAQPFVTAICADALRRLVCHLPRTHADPEDLEARTQCQLASWQSGVGIGAGGLGLCHVFGHQIGARYRIPYGLISCATLAATMEFNAPHADAALTEVASAFGAPDATAAAAAVRQFIGALGLPTRLGDIGVVAEMIDPVVSDVLEDVCVQWNPRPVDRTAVQRVLTAAMR